MDTLTFVLILLGFGVTAVLLVVAVTLAFIRGYQMGWRAHILGEKHAFPWPPLPERLRDYEKPKSVYDTLLEMGFKKDDLDYAIREAKDS